MKKVHKNGSKKIDYLKGDEIVITGVAGCFPASENIHKLQENLYNKIDMVSKCNDSESFKYTEFPKHLGKINGMEHFDNQFFRVPHWQANSFDPIGRKTLEQAFSAIFDAGINPETLKGSKLGVFVSNMYTDSSLSLYYSINRNPFVISGCSKSMISNRISYWIDGKGPSFAFDNGCAGSMSALEIAYNRMKSGEIDCALVGGCNLYLIPLLNMNMKRTGLLCLDGKTKCFDKNGDGYVRSDAINVYFLQKARDAKRIYSEVFHVKGKYFAAPDGSFSMNRNPKDLEQFFNEFYSEIDVSPYDVEYIEANAFGLAEADGNELEAIGNVFGKDKTIKIGSVKSNMGNAESASGACSVTKMCLAYQRGQIPANLYYNEPQNHITSVKEGMLQVVTENEPFDRGYTAINNFCFTGANFHTLLKGHYKPKNLECYKSTIPRLILVSGRQEESVNKMFDSLEMNPLDAEQCALLNNIFKYNISSHTGRGYTILDSNKNNTTTTLSRKFDLYSGYTPSVWFLYSGMGSQWAGMGEGLLSLPVFAAAIEKCHKVLQPKGLDIYKIITDKTNDSLNILNSLVAINAIQIGLTEVLKSIGIIPDKIIGHSVGELGCAYADGALTAEQTILAAYYRAKVSYDTKFIAGKMAAVGLGHQEVLKICPSEIQVACHNSSESATISGPAEVVTEFVKGLTAKGIFAKEVDSYNIAFHTRYIAEAGPVMLKLLKQSIVVPKLRSEKWLSTCYSPNDWNKTESKYASAEYFTHNLMSSVLFEEAARLIPNDAIIIEIAPHGLLQAIMKRSHSQCINLSLTRRNVKDSVKFFLESIGTLYQKGLNPDIDGLYPKVEFPVSSETPTLSHLVGWDHRVIWPVDKYSLTDRIEKVTTYKEFILSTKDDDYNLLKGHIRDGINVLPEAAVIVLAWETLAEYKGLKYKDLPVVFKNVKFYRELIIYPEEALKLLVTVQKVSNRFEVTDENHIISDGYIHELVEPKSIDLNISFNENDNHLNQNDIYTLLCNRGYSYGDEFQNLTSSNIERNKATIKWNDEWITFLDSVLQFNALSKDFNGISAVKLINELSINIDDHKKLRLTATKRDQYYSAFILKDIGDTKCGGVTLKDVVFNEIPQNEIVPQVLYARQFIAHFPSYYVDVKTALLVNLQILNENLSGNIVKIKEVIKYSTSNICDILKEITDVIPLLRVDIQTVDTRCEDYVIETDRTADVLIFHNFLENHKYVEHVFENLNEYIYILAIERKPIDNVAFKHIKTITLMKTEQQTIILMKKAKTVNINDITVISTHLDTAINVRKLKEEQKDKNIILVIEKELHNNVSDVIKEIIKTDKTMSLFIIDHHSPKFLITSSYYKEQIQKGLKINILEHDQWGSLLYIPVNSFSCNKIHNVKLIAKELYNVESLTWIDNPVISSKQTVQVCFSGLSIKDYKKLSGKEESEWFGMDFSGVDKSGQRVMGLLPKGSVASIVEADYDLLWPVPQHWSLQEAATVPLPYVHAFYCLAMRSSLYRNSNILITGAAGALGQAVIAVAHSLDCTVYGTVSNADKKRFLLKRFPKLDENNIGYTYDCTFLEMVVSRTSNKRCNIVINCGSGRIRESAMGCVGFMKNFLDTNDSDQTNNEDFKMFYLEEDRSYKSVNMSNIFNKKYTDNKKALQVMLSEGISKGFVTPLTSVVYSATEISSAFRLLACRSNRGRVLINMKDPMMFSQYFEAISRITLCSTNSYIVVCDKTELSIELIDRLVQRGARYLLIHFNAELMNGYFHVRYSLWARLGVKIEFSSNDLQTEASCQDLLKNANKSGPVNGIFIAYQAHSYTAQKKNDKITNQDYLDIALVASNLDKACRGQSNLRYFVIITAMPPNISNENTIEELERCCVIRDEHNFPSLFLRHVVNDNMPKARSLSTLFNAMDSSLKLKYVSVLSIDSIDKYNNKPIDANTNFNGGLEAFFTQIIEDEVLASEPIVPLKTKSRLSTKSQLLIDPEDTYILMIPGIEGSYKTLISVSEKLKTPALALQLVPKIDDNVQEMAKCLFNYIKMRIKLKSPFYLMGYSFGVNVALELAALLEKEGLVGVIYCLDSSPDALRVHLNAYLGNLTDEQLQNSLITHMFKLIDGHESTELNQILVETTNLSDKINTFINKIKNNTAHSHQYLRTLIQAVYDRIKLGKEYKPDYKLESELILLKGILHPNAEQLSEDYNLSKYTNKPVQVYNIESDHALALTDWKVSNFINRTLVL